MGLLKKQIILIFILFNFLLILFPTSNADEKSTYIFSKHIEFDVRGARSLVWGDYDNDGDMDLAFGHGNRENYIFTKQENDSYIKKSEFGIGNTKCIAFGDYDNDGDLDLAVANSGSDNALYINKDNGEKFIEENPFGKDATYLAWEDYDNDYDLDLAIGNTDSQNYLYDNNPTYFTPKNEFGYFSTYCLTWGDYDNDGDLDLAIGNAQQNYLYINKGNGSFEGVERFGYGLTYYVAWGDYDNDGDLDLAVGNDGQNYLYKNVNNDFYQIPSFGQGKTYCLAWGDYDDDGDLDLAVGNDGTNYLYINNGNGNFVEAINFGSKKTRSVAWCDYDNDGDLDIAIGNSDGYSYLYIYEKDSDSDGFGDSEDAFPDDPAASIDSDGDGYPEEWNTGKNKSDSTTGLHLDEYPDNPDEWKDSDGDGIGDNEDPIDFMENSKFYAIMGVALFIPIPLIGLGVKIYEKRKLKKEGYVITSINAKKENETYKHPQRRDRIQRPLPQEFYEMPSYQGRASGTPNYSDMNPKIPGNGIIWGETAINKRFEQQSKEEILEEIQQESLINMNELNGKHLMNIDGEFIGVIDDVILDINTMKINFFVVLPNVGVVGKGFEEDIYGRIKIPFNSIITAREVVIIE